MAEDQRPGAIYWIDHFVVPISDLDRWVQFMRDVLGATGTWGEAPPPGGPRVGAFLKAPAGYCHMAAFTQSTPIPLNSGLGKALPRYGLYIRPDDVEGHLRRLDRFDVPHTQPIRTTQDGEEGTAIYFQDPDGNQLEFWAPTHMPDGAMDGASAVKVGNIASATFESRDLHRTAGFYTRHCNIDPLSNADIGKDTLAFALAGGGRVVFKKVDKLDVRTGGSTRWRGVHSAYIVRDEEFIPSYRRIWDELAEWDYDEREQGPLATDPGDLPARTGMHGSAAGRRWKALYGRGDQLYDWDTNSFHFVGGVSPSPTLARYEGRYMDTYVESFLKARDAAEKGV